MWGACVISPCASAPSPESPFLPDTTRIAVYPSLPYAGAVMWYRLLGLLACIFTLTSCIVTYRDFPQVDLQTPPLKKKDFPIYYHFEPIQAGMLIDVDVETRQALPFAWSTIGPNWIGYDELQRVFEESSIFPKAFATDTAPTKGLYCLVSITERKPSRFALEWGGSVVFSLSFIPGYSGEGGYELRYDLVIDQQLKQTYHYEITMKGVTWIALLPFTWVNFFTYSGAEAFRATFYQFLLDAERDGYL